MKLLKKEDLKLYASIDAIAYCSDVQAILNLSTTNSFREQFFLNGVEGAFVKGILFKNGVPKEDEIDLYRDGPVWVKGTINEYNDEMQLVIESITTLSNTVSTEDVLANMMDTTKLSELNDLIRETGSFLSLNTDSMLPSVGLENCGVGTFVDRLTVFLKTINVAFSKEYVDEFILILSSLVNLYRKGVTLDNVLDTLKYQDTKLLRSILLNDVDNEYRDFVLLHHTIMKPRGVIIEINNCNSNRSGNYNRGS